MLARAAKGHCHGMSAEQDRALVSSEVSHPNSEPGQNAPHPPAAEPPDSFWARVKRHKVVEWTLAYVAFGYALLHTIEMLGEAFEWPLLVPRLTVFGLVLAAPIAVTLAWYHGHRARQRVSGPELSILIVLLLVAGSVMWWLSRNSHGRGVASAPAVVANTAVSPAPATGSFNPPPHSIAVLPFVNMSGDKEQEYFSDGLSEELLNDLARINELQVAARTSAFSFKGKDTDIGTIARKLNVGTVLEGSVRRSAHTVRVTAQLINAVTGFHMWSQSYDRDLGDVLKLQADIAQAVSNALKVTLLGDVPSKIKIGGTRNEAAYDAYLRAQGGYWKQHSASELMQVIDGYREAVRLDPNFALAFAELSLSLDAYARYAGPAVLDWEQRAREPALKAIALAPDLAEGHVALAASLTNSLNFKGASEEYERAVALAPGSARILRDYGLFAVSMGRTEEGLTALRRAVVLDPLNEASHGDLIEGLRLARRYDESIAAYRDALSQLPDNASWQWTSGLAYYALGDIQRVRSLCESKVKEGNAEAPWEACLAVVYQKLGRYADAEAWMKKHKARWGDAGAHSYAICYAQWGDTTKALEWLETALRLRDVGLQSLKVDPLLDPLRKDPRFQAIERALKFPD